MAHVQVCLLNVFLILYSIIHANCKSIINPFKVNIFAMSYSSAGLQTCAAAHDLSIAQKEGVIDVKLVLNCYHLEFKCLA